MKEETTLLLYGLEKGETREYMETLLCGNARNMDDIEKVKAIASRDGWHSFRVHNFTMGEPDFTKALLIPRRNFSR